MTVHVDVVELNNLALWSMSWDQDIDKHVGDSLRMLRTNAGLTQEGLAERLASLSVPMSQQTIAKIESGGRSLRLSEAVAIVQALNGDDDDGYGARLEHLVAKPSELVAEEESQRILDRILAAADQIKEASREFTLYSLAGVSWLEDTPEAHGRASGMLKAFTDASVQGLFNFAKAGIRQALEEGMYADEPTYREIPEYAKPFLTAIEDTDDSET